MTKRKENPLSRSECGKRARAAVKNLWSPFQHMDEDWKEENGRKGGVTTASRVDMRELGRKGGSTKKTRYRKVHRVTK